ncbi:MAG: class I SAM-dependent methyltransferase [Alphaproteobacteria bacterium]|nr:class I SAM-dependent methyltransferase [Alphaproteobacteria bacterium]MBM3653666.1 class I SAM-dependent methyltransferase [Alphaproteobacteria bacterium]
MARIAPNLTGVPETMLWTLHNRACEARRPDGILLDPKGVEIYDTLDYDYVGSFGAAEPSHAIRADFFDNELRAFLKDHPEGVIVNLGEGLETQRFRVEDDEALWLCVDLPDAIAIRERFIKPDERHRHLAMSALDRGWFDAVPADRAVYITAQGLLMYFAPEDVGRLICDMAARFPKARLCFDHIPEWLSKKTLKGWRKGRNYVTPEMPWGINQCDIEPILREWAAVERAETFPYKFERGWQGLVFNGLMRVGWIRNRSPGMTCVRFA